MPPYQAEMKDGGEKIAAIRPGSPRLKPGRRVSPAAIADGYKGQAIAQEEGASHLDSISVSGRFAGWQKPATHNLQPTTYKFLRPKKSAPKPMIWR